MAGERALTQPELNRAVLARQFLLERARTPLPRALERVGGIQAQYAPSMYVGLWSRLESFTRDDLTRALERRRVVQGTLMRVTIHLVSRADYWPIASAVREARRALWLRTHPGPPDARELAAAARALRSALASAPSGTLRRAEVEELLGKPGAQGVGLWLDLVRVPPSGTWERRRADLYGDADTWIGRPRPGAPDGVELLVRRHLGAFGPAAAGDIATWAGLPVRSIAPVLDRLALRRFRGPAGELLLDLPRAPLPHAETPAPVRFLPTYDATLLAHARRAGILPEEHRRKIFHTKMPQSVGTFLVDGAVAGTWRLVDDRITPEPFGRLDAATRREVREEAGRLTDFHRVGG
jgi:hypothetical protein